LSKERYASTPGYCNELITLNVLNLMKERIWIWKLQILFR
jgi:hypothetical protein